MDHTVYAYSHSNAVSLELAQLSGRQCALQSGWPSPDSSVHVAPVVPGGAHSITGHLPSELVKLVARPPL
jgi:hypothetical protein